MIPDDLWQQPQQCTYTWLHYIRPNQRVKVEQRKDGGYYLEAYAKVIAILSDGLRVEVTEILDKRGACTTRLHEQIEVGVSSLWIL